jgi:hypothetical protein
MKLTRRQVEFIQKMIELRREFAGPVHYSLLAERLGVSPFTAYDMLCLLEEKGFVSSEYQLPNDKSGPGRAERVFFPSAMAQAHDQGLLEQIERESLRGEALLKFALEKLRKAETPDQEMSDQMMSRLVPRGHGEVRYCLEVMTIAALRLKNTSGRQVLLDHLAELLPGENGSCKANLCLLGGFVFGLLAQHCAISPEWLLKLHEHLNGYVKLVIEMNDGDCNRLAFQLMGVLTLQGEAPE